ncbi:hypothetical protein niasHS_002143 [Heterodera schachtii]|uniref:Uncharacterized protein n=1 Tax=Heterodera schachtii TaxID=97005 RepID=A0ABD2KME9_HETSC
MALSSPISQSSAAAAAAPVFVDKHQLQFLRQPRHSSLSSSPSSYSNPSPHSTPSSDESITSSLKMQYNGRDENNDEGGRWVAMARAAANDGGGNGGGVLSMLQKAFCSNLFASSPSATYRSVLTRASMDSGLELDEMEKSRRDERRKRNKRRERTGEEEEEEEKMMEEGESGREREHKSEKAQNGETTEDAKSEETERAEENKKRRSIGRLFSLLLFPSANSSPPFPMFDFPALPSSASFALSSPVAQLSHSNAVLVQENERLNDRVGELELMLRDHVAHINSIYHSLHSLHGFHALQLPDGELVHLSQFHGFPLRFICTKTTESEAIVADEEQHRILEQATDNRHTVGQARRFMLQQRQRHRQQQGSVNESSSSGSSSSFASSSSTFDSSLAADPTDFSLAMMRRLCIRPVARDDSEEMQAFMEWLKSGDSAGNESIANGDFSAALSPLAEATKSCAWPKAEMDAERTSGTKSKQSAEHEAASTNGASVASSVAQRSQRQPPVYSVMSKSQRMRTQCPSLSSRRRSPLLSPASSSSSASFLAAPSSPSSATFTHHGGFGGGGGSASGADETAAARSPRRSGIGITNMKRMGSRPSDAQKSAKRHLI